MTNVSTTTAAIYQAVLDSLNSSGECGVLPPAPPGKSAYDVAVDNGFVGSESQWLDSLQYEQEQEIARLEARIVGAEKYTNDTSYAANRPIGPEYNRLPLSQDVLKAANSRNYGFESSTSFNCNSLEAGSRKLVVSGAVNTPPAIAGNTHFLIDTITTNADGRLIQIAYGYNVNSAFLRNYINDEWGSWDTMAANQHIFNVTTASSPNVVVASNGNLTRASSSERYKDIITDLELDDEHYADAMSLNPIIYRSKSEIDNPDYHFYSFSAEKLGAYDPAFTLWRDTEMVTDDEGNVTEQPLDEREAEGINLNAIVAFLHATNVKQGKLIAELERKVSALESVVGEVVEPEVVEEVPVEEDPKD